MKRFISLLMIFTSTAFGADGWGGPMHNEIARYQPSESSHGPTMDFAPAPSGMNFEVGFTNFHAPLSHNGQSAEFNEELAKANDLFHAGDKQGLLRLHGELTSIGSKFSFRAREYRQQANYVDGLINSKYLESFQRLNQAPPSEVKQVLREIVSMNPDPSIKAEAMIAADKMVGDIFCDYGNEFKLDMTGHEPTDMMVTTRLGSYQVEKLMPAKGTTPDKVMMEKFVEGVMRVANGMPQELQNEFVKGAIQGFVEAFVDPVRITQENVTIAQEVAVTLVDTFVGYHIRSKEYGEQRTQIIDGYAKEVARAFKTYNSREWGQLAGESTVRAIHGKVWYEIGKYACGQIAGVLEGSGASRGVLAIETTAAKAPETMESILGKMEALESNGLNKRYNSQLDKGYESAIKWFKSLNPSNVKKIPVEHRGIKGQGLVGKLDNGITVVARSVSSENYAPTLEFQIPHPGGSGNIFNKVRF